MTDNTTIHISKSNNPNLSKGSYTSKDMYCTHDNKPVEINEHTIVETPVFPSKYFDTYDKPKIFITYPDTDIDILESRVVQGVQSNDLEPNVVCAYLVKVMLTWCELNSEEDWQSYKTKIAKMGEYCTPGDLCDIQYGTTVFSEYKSTRDVDPMSPISLMIFLLAPYRLAPITNDEYRTRVEEVIYDRILCHGKFPFRCPQLALFYSWARHPTYCTIVGIIDMFLYRFRATSSYSEVRVSTLTSRMKDCAAITASGAIQKVTGMSLREVLRWVWSLSVSKDFKRLVVKGQETDSDSSYMPYLKDLGISKKSPYSTTFNPNLYVWAHLVCGLLGSERSWNAIFLDVDDVTSIVFSARWFAYACLRCAEVDKQFREYDELEASIEASKRVQTPIVLSADNEPTDKNGAAWFDFMVQSKKLFSKEMDDVFVQQTSRVRAMREGTIGSYLASSGQIVKDSLSH